MTTKLKTMRTSNRGAASVTLLTFSTLLLTGCAHVTSSGWVEVDEKAQDQVEVGKSPGWVEGRNSVTLYLYNASSCSYTPEETSLEESTLIVKLDKEGQCITTDISGPHRWKYIIDDDVEKIFVQVSSEPVELPKLN